MAYFAHLIIVRGDQRLLPEGKVVGAKRRGVPKNVRRKDVITWTEMNYVERVLCRR